MINWPDILEQITSCNGLWTNKQIGGGVFLSLARGGSNAKSLKWMADLAILTTCWDTPWVSEQILESL